MSLASPWTGLATPTAVSPKPMPVMPASLLIRRGCAQTSVSSSQVKKRSPSCSSSSLAAETSCHRSEQDHHPPQREALLSLFPALERALDLNSKAPLTLLTHYQTPAQLRRAGHKRVASYLRNRGVKGSANIAHKALAAARSQSVTLPAQEVASRIVAELAAEILALKERIARIDEELGRRFFARPEARILTSLPGMGPILGAEFLVAVGDVSAFESADQLAAYAGLVPAARDSGKRVGKARRMQGGNKTLKRVFYQSAFASLRSSPQSRAFYDRKRAEGKRHTQALIALARRKVNVVWAMLRDGTTFETRSAA
jgi:hypothetical protein